MSLTELSDFQGAGLRNRILQRLRDPSSPMPPVNRPRLSNSELTELERWVRSGAQGTANTRACNPQGGGGGGANVGQQNPADCETLFEVRATAGGGTAPYQVPQGEGYHCFNYNVPWRNKHQAFWIDQDIDNSRVVHHFLLYYQNSSVLFDKSHQNCVGLHPASSVAASWAPGEGPLVLPPDVGLQLPTGPNGSFTLEIHYYNNTGRRQPDRSGARVCASTRLRRNEASIHWLGTEGIIGIGRFNAQGTCNVQREAHLINIKPHMHETGVHMSTRLTRANGSSQMLHDAPFSFENQIGYDVDVTVRPGDRLTTTCTYNSLLPVTFGPGTGDEMCYNYVAAYPAGALGRGASILPGGSNRCIQ